MACVVIIEDNPGDLLMIREAVNRMDPPLEMIPFEDGPPALAALCDPGTCIRPDAILLDVRLRSSDGLEVLRKLRAIPHLAKTPVAILTSSTAEADERQALSLGARFVPKSFRVDEFLDSIGNVLRQMVASGPPTTGV
ncbi:MAG TPA: response regulator [Bryobacteraceae bacterium]|jgi:two-component system response regulator|nr:response regulator [Bryobacteraceae bacterium]